MAWYLLTSSQSDLSILCGNDVINVYRQIHNYEKTTHSNGDIKVCVCMTQSSSELTQLHTIWLVIIKILSVFLATAI